MILAIDIGNSNLTLGGFSGDELSFVARISTDSTATRMTSDFSEWLEKIGAVIAKLI